MGRFEIRCGLVTGKFVIFGSLGLGMHWVPADGSVKPQQLIPTRSFQMPSSVTPDGTRLAFQQIDGSPQIWFVDLKESDGKLIAGTPVRFMTTEYNDSGAVVSPDGQWVAYESNESGQYEVYVRPFSSQAAQGKVLISSGGGIFAERGCRLGPSSCTRPVNGS